MVNCTGNTAFSIIGRSGPSTQARHERGMRGFRVVFAIVYAVLGSAILANGEITVCDIGYKTKPSIREIVAMQVCAGLMNRNESTDANLVFTLRNNEDVAWLAEFEGITDPPITPYSDLISRCLSAGQIRGYLRYNATSQQRILPQIITVAGVLSIVPLEATDPAIHSAKLMFDAVKEFSGMGEMEATNYIFTHYVNQTTTMSFMNPGLDTTHPINPPLTGTPALGLTDFIVKEKIFNLYLVDACIPLTQEHKLMSRIASNNPWPRPIPVYGYNNAFAVAGDLFEAETGCVGQHNMGQIATDNVNNLSFFNRKRAISSPILQNPEQPARYNASKVYLGVVIGDGDNIAFLKGSRADWMRDRLNRCKSDPDKGCFPLMWSVSPHTLHLAPDLLRWFYNQSYATGSDYFVLPPSGHLYSYPGMLNPADQASYVSSTETDCHLLNTSASVDWEFFGGWEHAIKTYFPQYAKNGVVRGFFPVNVPFSFPVFAFRTDEFIKTFADKVVLFRPREWRGTGTSKIPFSAKNYLTAEQMAQEISGYPPGTCAHIYLTSDGGAGLGDLYDMVGHLGEHVELVSQSTLVDMALASELES